MKTKSADSRQITTKKYYFYYACFKINPFGKGGTSYQDRGFFRYIKGKTVLEQTEETPQCISEPFQREKVNALLKG